MPNYVREFKNLTIIINLNSYKNKIPIGPVAQLVERGLCKAEASGSNNGIKPVRKSRRVHSIFIQTSQNSHSFMEAS